MPKLVEIDIEPGAVLHRYSSLESKELAKKWLDSFGADGAPNIKAYMWHVFSFNSQICVSLQEARAQYEKQIAPSYIVLTNDRKQAVETDVRPTFCSESDVYVFPPNMAWTMVFTHEDDWLGPYFSKHKQYEKLHQENLYHIRKNHEFTEAKKKGWA